MGLSEMNKHNQLICNTNFPFHVPAAVCRPNAERNPNQMMKNAGIASSATTSASPSTTQYHQTICIACILVRGI